jgi:hypothetical protein
MASFNSGTRAHPTAPVPREVRQVIADLLSGRLDTNTRYGRKHQWKVDQAKRYIYNMLTGKMQMDPISIGRHSVNGQTREPAVNGNNRLRSILQFVRNEFGVDSTGPDGRMITYYYNEVPAAEMNKPSRRSRCRVLTDEVRNTFDNFPILFNVRENLSESEEIAWYVELNTNMKAHSSGHLLVAAICDPASSFANGFLATFPAMKTRVNERFVDADTDSLGAFLSEITDIEATPMNDDDKRENVLLSHAYIFNLLVNGMPFDDKFKGDFSEENLQRNVSDMKRIFSTAIISPEVKAEWARPIESRPYQQRFFSPSYLLGPIAWSLATNQPHAVDTWTRFLSQCVPNTIHEVYEERIANLKYDDTNKNKYKTAWERVTAHMSALE